MSSEITPPHIKPRIFTIRGVQVMLDRDLANLYGVSTTRLNEQVSRNSNRFPPTFLFQLSTEELKYWISQNATSNRERKGMRKLPMAFTELGVAMVSAVLKTETATRSEQASCAVCSH